MTNVGVLATAFARGLQIHSPQKIEGAGKTGCALHPRSHVQMHKAKNAHEHTGSAEAVRPSLRNGFNSLFSCSPRRDQSLFVTVAPKKRELLANLTPAIGASGPHDFAVRLTRCSSKALPRPPLPAPTSVTMANAPSLGTGCARSEVICPDDQVQPLRHIGTTGNSAKCCQDLFEGSMCFSFRARLPSPHAVAFPASPARSPRDPTPPHRLVR
jgi:hypothetical protein